MKPITFRLEDEVYDQLVELSEVFDKSMNTTINDCVRSIYDQYKGDPKAQYAIEQLRDLKGYLEEMTKKLDTFKADTKPAEGGKILS